MLDAVRLLSVLLLLVASAWGADPGVIRGVYSDHSTTLQSARLVGYDVRAAVVRRVDSIARCNVNVIWWTNLPNDPVMIEHIVRTCRARGIECVCGSGWWYAGPFPVGGQWANLQALHNALPADARPWRWSLGDETTPAKLADLRTLADRCQAAKIPTTMVQVPEYHSATLDAMGTSLPLLACDVYPVMQPGLGTVDNIAWAKSTHAAVISRSRAAGVRGLLMTQGFGGNDPTFALPSPAQSRWQVWSAVAAGSPGAVVFAAGMPSPDGGPTPPSQSLIDWDRPAELLTPQGDAVAATFGRLKTIEAQLDGATLHQAPAWGAVGLRGDCVAIFQTAKGKRLLLVVADPDATAARTLKVTLPGVYGMKPLASSTGGTLQALRWPWSMFFPATLSATIQPGDCWVGELR